MPPERRPRLSSSSAAEAARRALALGGASDERRHRLTHRLAPTLLALVIVSLLLGLITGALTTPTEERIGRDYAIAWQHSDYAGMYALLTPTAQRRISEPGFAAAYRSAADTATATHFEPGKVKKAGSAARVPMRVLTRVFGPVDGTVELPIVADHVDWHPQLVFPGVRPGERLTRRTQAPPRARIVDRRGHVIVSGPASARTPGAGAASSIAGSMGPAKDPAQRTQLYARGFPPNTPVGTSGLERALEIEVEGSPGGELLAGARPLARSRPRPAPTVRSTIDLRLQAAADQALAGRFGGIAALEPRTAKVRALAGIAFSAPQPPGSTFKIITSTAVLEARAAKLSTTFPVESKAIIDGVPLQNANGESCGGTLLQSFAKSCNSVFAPLGVKVGAKRLVDTAERYGFNARPTIPGAAPSTLPDAGQIDTPLAVGSTAIGQGKVLATPLEMAVVASTIANGGIRRTPTLLERQPPSAPIRVTSRHVAHTIERMMIEVVRNGTGTSASLAPSVQVAGKTGTAELQSTVGATTPGQAATGSDTDAWFSAFAPTHHPKLAVGVLFVKAGAGGQTAAPAARVVLSAGAR